MTTDNCTQATDHPNFSLFSSIAISKQLNPEPYLGGVHSISLAHYYRKRPCCVLVNSQFHMWTSPLLRPMNMVFGLGTRPHVHMHTTLENGVLCNGQQPGSVVNNYLPE